MGTAKERLEKLDNVTKQEKLNKLDKIAAALNKSKKYASENGDILIGRVTSMQTDVETISSGSLVLDSCLGGGFGKGRIIEVYGRESSGKCVTEDTNIVTENGLMTFKEMFELLGHKTTNTTQVINIEEKNFYVINENNELEKVIALTKNGSKKTKKITLSDGRTEEITYNHPIRVITEHGNIVWRQAKNIKENDVVVSVLHDNSIIGKDTMSIEMATFLGYIISEGYCGDRNKITFTNYYDDDIKEEYKNLIYCIQEQNNLDKININEYSRVSSKDNNEYICDFHVNSVELREILKEEYGLQYGKSKDKCVLPKIKQGNKEIQAAFLSSLFEGDGWIEKNGNICYASLSRDLINDVQLLLRGFGISSTIMKKFNNTYNTESWTLYINGTSSNKFIEQIGFRSERKNLLVIERIPENKGQFTQNIPYLSNIIKDLVDSIGGNRDTNNIIRDLSKQANGNIGMRASKSKLDKIIDWAEQKEYISQYSQNLIDKLKLFSENNYITFETVKSIEDSGNKPTFDITMEKTHSFIGNGIINHNTSVALTTIANVQRDGGTAVFIDAENAFDPSYAQKLGVQLDELFFSQPDSAEQALDLIADLINTNEVDLIVLDSVAALVPQKELEGDAADITVGEVARLLSKQLRKTIKPASKTGTTVIFINQIRDKIGGFSPFGTPTSTPGGNALKFYSSQRVEISKGSPISEGKDNVIGTEMKFTVKKNKIAPPFRKGSTVITYNHGINREAEMITVGSEYDTVILRPNNRTYVDAATGEVLGTSKDAAIQFLKDNPEIFKELTERLQKALNDKAENDDNQEIEETDALDESIDEDFDEEM